MNPKKDTVVGRGASDAGATPAPSPQSSALPGLSDILKGKLGSQGIVVDPSKLTGAGGDVLSTLSNSTQIGMLAKILKLYGYSKGTYTNADKIKAVIQTDFANILNTSKTFVDLVNGLKANYVPSAVTQTGGPSITQSITNYSPDVLNKLIDLSYQAKVGRNASPEEKAARLKELQALEAKGSITTTKKVGDKTVVESTPGFSNEAATELINKKIEQTAPMDIKNQQALDFNNWITKQMGGGM